MNTHDFKKAIIKSTDEGFQTRIENLDKYRHMEIWVRKAIAILDQYLLTLYLIDLEHDKIKKGKMQQDLDCYIMSSILYYLRCFHSDDSDTLTINKITKDQSLREYHQKIVDLRNDEFTHWKNDGKGTRSKLNQTFNIKRNQDSSIEISKENIHVNFEDVIGPPNNNARQLNQLYEVTLKHILSLIEKSISSLNSDMNKPENRDLIKIEYDK